MPPSIRQHMRFAILEELEGGPRTRAELVAALRGQASAAAAAIGGERVDLGAVKPALRELVDEGLVHEHGSPGVRGHAGEPLWAASAAGRTAFAVLSVNRAREAGR
jgi:transposase